MENIFNPDNKKTFKNDPEYFGSYLNLARQNIFNINNHVAKKFGIKTLNDEGEIPNSFFTNNKAKVFVNKQSHIFSTLKRFMPIVKVFDFETLPKVETEGKENTGKNFEEFSTSLKMIFSELNDFRNDYTHYYSLKSGEERKIKTTDQLKEFLETNIKRAIKYTQQRFKDVFEDDDFKIALNTITVNEKNEITQDGIVFLTAMFLDRENAFQFINKIVGLKGTQKKGFLANREVLMAFCLTKPHDKLVSEDTIQAFSLNLINELNKCPKELYNVISENEKQKFQPDIKNIENVIDNSIPDSVKDYETYLESITKKTRSQNRFSYFALKYIDENKLFKNIRFQIDLGKVVLDEYTKPLKGVDEQRKVVQNAKAFGRLQDLTDEKKVLENINKSNKNTDFEQFAPHYSFNKKRNKIGISINKEDTAIFFNKKTDKQVKSNLKQPVVDAFLSINELPKIILTEFFNKGKSEEIINDFILLNNSKLFNKDFIKDIKLELNDFDEFQKRSQGRKEKTAYNEKGLKHLRYRKQKLNEVLKEHNLNDKQIPSRILEYWLNIKDVDNETAISDKIKLMKRDCIDRLKQLENGKAPKIGEMATFLAKDIVNMVIDKDKKKKITSFYYDKMQESLALYADNEKKELFIHICKNELGLYDNGGHPFLKNISLSNIKYTQDIYKKYLEAKGKKMVYGNDKSWMQETFYRQEYNENAGKKLTVVKLPEDKSQLPYTLMQLDEKTNSFNEWFEYVTKGKKYKEENKQYADRKKSIDLPTNLFDDTLKELLKADLCENNISFKEDANYNQLFKLWWEKCRHDEVQQFYDAEREYTFEEEKLNFIINTKEKFKDYYNEFAETVYQKKQTKRKTEQITNKRLPDIQKNDVIKTIRNKIGKTEREIRILQEEDRLMLMMFESLTGTDLNSKLNNIEELLNETIEIKQQVTGILYFDEKGTFVHEKEKRKSITKYITEKRKRKEFSVLKKLIFDRRLPELFEYFTEDNIPFEKIKIEIDTYNKTRDIVFDLVFKLEKNIITKDKQGILEMDLKLKNIENKTMKTKHIQHKPYLMWLAEKGLITQDEFAFMYMVRNTFSHNQFPQKRTMELFIKDWNNNKFAKQILEIYKQKNEVILEKINKI